MEHLFILFKEIWVTANFGDMTTAEVFLYTFFGLLIIVCVFTRSFQQGLDIRERREYEREKRKAELKALKRLNKS